MVLAQYYMLIRMGRSGYRYLMEAMQENARTLGERIKDLGPFQLIGEGEEQLPLAAFNLAEEQSYDEFDISSELAAERGWMLPAYTMPPNADKVRMMRALVKLTLGRTLVDKLADDMGDAIEILAKRGGLDEHARKRAHTGTGY